MSQQKRKLKIYLEEAKNRQTTHWDWDCMTTEEIQAAYREANHQRNQNTRQPAARPVAAYVNRWFGSIFSIFRNRNAIAG